LGKILAVVIALMFGPFGFPTAPASAGQVDGTVQAAEVKASDPLANFLTILNVPARGVVCGLSGLLGSIVMGASGGARYDLAAEIIQDGCSGPWVITPQMVHESRLRPDASGRPLSEPIKVDDMVLPARPPDALSSLEAFRSAREPDTLSSLEALRRGELQPTPLAQPLGEIYFDFDRYNLRADARITLDGHADWLKENPSARVEVEGHCDGRGSNEYNLALGAERAQAAKDYLIRLGVAEERLSTISYGEELPACYEETEECWQKNRRARFVIIRSAPSS